MDHDLTFGLDQDDHSSGCGMQGSIHAEDEKSSMSSMSSLTGFLFGNIDEKGELEEDFLDEDSKRQLGSLSQLGVGAMVQELTQEVSYEALSSSIDEDYDRKSPSAVDFSDITEIVDDEDDDRRKPDYEIRGQIDDQEREEDDRKLMPPPSWLPCPTQPISIVTSDSGNSSASAPLTSVAKFSTDEQTSPSSLSPGKKLNTPLADMMPPELANVDVTSLFPEFRHGQVLRFSRLFKPAHVPHVWRKKRKKKDDDEEKKGAKGENKKKDSKEDTDKSQMDSAEKENRPEVGQEEMKKDEGEDGKLNVKSEPCIEEELDIKLNIGRQPKKEEMLEDDEELLKRPADHMSSRGQSGHDEMDQDVEVAPWRYGPAQYWYDYLGVDETGHGFHYNFKVKPEELKKIEEEEAIRLDKDLDYDRYLMVTQQRWEDKIIWDGEKSKQKVLEEHKKNAEFAGWVPSTNNRTFSQSRSQSGLLQRSKSILAKAESDAGRDSEWFSIFPVENEELIYRNWEDDIIWDAEVG